MEIIKYAEEKSEQIMCGCRLRSQRRKAGRPAGGRSPAPRGLACDTVENVTESAGIGLLDSAAENRKSTGNTTTGSAVHAVCGGGAYLKRG